MLTLILQTQEGQKIELNVEPEDTFADLKSQYSGNDGVSDSLEQLITNGANVPENTKIFDYITGSANKWFSADQSVDADYDCTNSRRVETLTNECCAQGCLNSDVTTPGKQFFPLPTDHSRLAGCLIEIGRPELYNQVLGLDAETSQKYLLCSNHFSEEASYLSPLCTVEQSAVSLLKPKNERMWMEVNEETLLNDEKDNDGLEKVNLGDKNYVLEILDTVQDFEHPGILCRLCGEPTTAPIHLYALDDENEEFNLADKINLCLPVTVTVTDPLPKQICESCNVKLNTCHELALSALQTEDKMKFLLREKKLCVNDNTEQQCPLCLEGDMQIVKKSGIYLKDDLKNKFCCSATTNKASSSTGTERIISTENCNDLLLSRVNLPELDNSISESTVNSPKVQKYNDNILPLPEGEFPCSNCSAKINVVSIRTHKCSLENRDSPYSCLICNSTIFAYSHELELHYFRHGIFEEKFTCDLCNFECEKLEEATEHVKTCRPEFWEIRCETCDKTFPNNELINNHDCYQMSFELHESAEKPKSLTKVPKKLKKQPVQYNCFFCQKQFSRKKSLKTHISASHNEEMDNPPFSKCYKCKSCNQVFACETDAEVHITLRHLGPFAASCFPDGQEFTPEELTISRLYICEYCERCFSIPSSLHDHRENEHTRSLEYSCQSCDLVFDSRRQLTNHKTADSHHRSINIHGVRQFYVCKYCDKMFLHYSSLSSHVLQHQEIAPYLCRPCNANFETYKEIAVHRDIAHPYQSTVHERVKRSYKCQYCQKQFSYEVALVKHIRIHTGERPYKCSICGKGFAQSSGLNIHVKIHSDVRPYSCPKCPRTFKIKGDCDNHVKRHSGNRPYKCEYCSKAFMTQHVFSQHRRIHTNDRPYKCDVCGEAFRRSHVLTVHRRIHTGEKPHVCDLCPKTYRQRGDLVKHRRVQHGINAATVAKLGLADNSYNSFAKSNGKLADRRSGNSSLLSPL